MVIFIHRSPLKKSKRNMVPQPCERGQLVSWCFELSHPQTIISGLKTNFNPSPTALLLATLYTNQQTTNNKSSSIGTKVCFHTQFNHLLSWVARCLGPWKPITTTSCNWLGWQATRHQTPLVVVVDTFFPAREDSGRMFDSSFPACTFFFLKD